MPAKETAPVWMLLMSIALIITDVTLLVVIYIEGSADVTIQISAWVGLVSALLLLYNYFQRRPSRNR